MSDQDIKSGLSLDAASNPAAVYSSAGQGSEAPDSVTAELGAAPPIRCFLIDDERLARLVLRHQIERRPDLQVVGEASDLAGAMQGIRCFQPEVVFLDIGVQGQNGFDLIPELGMAPPLVVFVTAYDQFALRAFDVRAVDYLVKPVDPLRFDEAADRLHQRLRPSLKMPVEKPDDAPLFVQAGKGGCWISPHDIAFVRSDRNYSSVTLADGQRMIVRQTMAVWKSRLTQPRFLQVDRSLILNLRHVRRTNFSGHSGFVYLNNGGQPLELGRQGTVRLKEALSAVKFEGHHGSSVIRTVPQK